MTKKHDYISAQLQNIRSLYLIELPNKIVNLKQLWQTLCATNDPALMNQLRIIVHSLAGSSGSFDIPEMQTLSEQFEHAMHKGNKCTAPLRDELLAILDQMQQVAEKVSQQESISAKRSMKYTLNTGIPAKNHILLIESDEHQGQELLIQLKHFGYRVTLLQEVEHLLAHLTKDKPDLVLCDIMQGNKKSTAIQVVAEMRKTEFSNIPVLFSSIREDLDARLQSIRVGGIGFFRKPIHLGELIDRIDQLLMPSMIERQSHVLIVDNDSTLTQYHSLLLEEAGIKTWTLNDPAKLLESINIFNPDLILMDLYFPECTGIELASIIRQQKDYLGIPILFLSIEKNMSEKLLAYAIGADDFLTKPIQPEHFVPLIEQRIRRFRSLRDMMLHDSLTGAYNHTSIKNLLDGDVARARRESRNLVVAMLDVDHFKSVNDTYGHPAGDRVLRDLSHLIRRRLRQTDRVGRYGGEEFLIVLNDTNLETAHHLIDNVRQHFSEIIHDEGDQTFTSTFSVGMAQFTDFPDSKRMITAADDALYHAKTAGRNQICLAASPAQHAQD
jgi:diguanylate cyclase (GGDEF)-like protein